jgi:hypothetical protein
LRCSLLSMHQFGIIKKLVLLHTLLIKKLLPPTLFISKN